MCTAIHFTPHGKYFGRNLDLEYHYNEEVTVTPRGFDFKFKAPVRYSSRYAIIGMATSVDGYPLYYDAANEKGLSMAGLNFPGNAVYNPECQGFYNIAPFEFIPFILSQCADMTEAMDLLGKINLIDRNFNQKYPLTPLHWMIADRHRSVTVEPLKDGLKIYENKIGVLTNNPPFEFHLQNLCNYSHLSNSTPSNHFATPLTPYSKGLGAFGLPGDGSSLSRFVRAAFHKSNAVCEHAKEAEVNQFFHILGVVEQPRGAVRCDDGTYHITVYSSCCDLETGVYYYTTYENRKITGVDLFAENLDGTEIISYSIISKRPIEIINSKN